MKKVWVNKADSFEEAEKFDESYYRTMSPEERLETVQFLREIYTKIKRGRTGEGRKRLRRTIKIIQQQ